MTITTIEASASFDRPTATMGRHDTATNYSNDNTNDSLDSAVAAKPTLLGNSNNHAVSPPRAHPTKDNHRHAPGSVGSSCSEDTHPTEGTAASAAAPVESTEDDVESEGEDAPATSPTTTKPNTPPKFYRLNAFTKESCDTDSSDDDREADPNVVADNDEARLRQELGYEDSALGGTTATTSDSSAPVAPKQKKRGVRFRNVCIREYAITIGDNPYCSYGVPICLDWSHGEEEVIPIDFFEASNKRKRTARRMLLNPFQRRDMLWRSGYPLEDIEKAIKRNDREKFRRSMALYFSPLLVPLEMIYFGAEQCFQGASSNQNDENDTVRVEKLVQQQQQAALRRHQETADTEIGGMSVVEQFEHEKPRRRLSFKSSQASSYRGSKDGGSVLNDWSLRSGSAFSDISHDRDDPYAASNNSRFKEYAVRVDRGQHDKATEIILCNLQRPHMRAFHASWLSFFTAFFMWFAITPLLSEIKISLDLTKQDIWYSSLCGTAGTIIMRIIMGPACDKFGARICMAFILATAAIPCALTGLVNTSKGLSVVRTFIGVAGSSFVACQYWTSQMFTREVAGTANALVAGWGNLGGGVTQLVMGSALFPLFKIFYGYEDSDSSELAWRTVFVIPAVFSLLAAYTIVYHCDDSPKGDYRERVRQQEITVVSPTASLCAACQNWNVWILLLQYACCFGVEVTMTNGTALYFKDEFGQSTVSAAAMASGKITVLHLPSFQKKPLANILSFNDKYY